MADSISSTQFTSDKWEAQRVAEKSKMADGTGTNPLNNLDKDAFLKLLLTELQYQDPTDPMDTSKMLEQTSQLATLETQQKTNAIMQELAEQMQSSFSMTAMSALGKIAHIDNALVKDGDGNINFNLNFEEAATNGTISILNSSGATVKSININDISQGLGTFTWDGTDNNGEKVPDGSYTATASYITADGIKKSASSNSYPVEAVRFKDGTAQIKINGSFINIDSVKEFTEPTKA